ncbi:restriction endonuclease subunit S [Thiococcus pfennigii]|uniref:restriction endonuclease subunit S n=1 Tax=Thiococcus pfennigii TaxID=1057 RepID=UPI0019032C80|nr:restriction endonuclease subunit S [Thiococcus pfennigii]MBK1700239.1 hypothetical protein [Thiococcus pfennigii]
MGEWMQGVLGNFVELKRGYDLPKKRRQTGPFPLVSSSGITDHHVEAMVKGPGVVTGRYGTLGQVFFIRDDFWPLNTTLYVRDFKNNDPRFVSYFLQSMDFMAYSDKAAVPGLNRNHLHVAPVYYPASLSEQQEIASLLGALDDKIDLNRQTNETLEALARAIFKDWFVDFGPTRAKAEGRPPYLAPELWDLFPDALDDEDKPVGWEFGTLADIAALNPESWSKKNPPDQIEYVDLANAKWGTIESTEIYEWSNAPSRAQRILRPGNTIVGTVRPGNGSYAFIGQDGLTASTGFAVLVPKAQESREFVYLASTSPENIARLTHLADGAAYPAVRPNVVAATEVVVPSKEAMARFSDVTAPLLNRLEANKRENILLAQTRDLLLPKLMSGEIRLREAARLVEAVA